MSDFKVETKCLHSGYTPSKGEPCALPIYQSTTYKYDTTDEMGQLFDLKAEGYFYTRLQNPTNDAVAAKICRSGGWCCRYPYLFRTGCQLLCSLQYLRSR